MDRVSHLVREVITSARQESITFLAAAVAYYGFVSLVPLLVLAIVVATTVGGEAFADAVLAVLERFLTGSARDAVRESLVAGPATAGATVVSVLALLWSGLKVFRGLNEAFSVVYGTTGRGSLVADVRDAVVALTSIGVAVLVAASLGLILQGIGGAVGVAAGLVLVPVTLLVAFLPLYYLFPNVSMSVREALPGALTAALGWWALASGFGIYANLVGPASLYGVLGGALLLSTWLYFAAIVIVLGAVVNATLSRRDAIPPADVNRPVG